MTHRIATLSAMICCAATLDDELFIKRPGQLVSLSRTPPAFRAKDLPSDTAQSRTPVCPGVVRGKTRWSGTANRLTVVGAGVNNQS